MHINKCETLLNDYKVDALREQILQLKEENESLTGQINDLNIYIDLAKEEEANRQEEEEARRREEEEKNAKKGGAKKK